MAPFVLQLLEAKRDAANAQIAFKKDRVRKLKEENERLSVECEELLMASCRGS